MLFNFYLYNLLLDVCHSYTYDWWEKKMATCTFYTIKMILSVFAISMGSSASKTKSLLILIGSSGFQS